MVNNEIINELLSCLGFEARGGLFADAAEGGVPELRGAAPGARRSDRADSDRGRSADRARPVVVPAVRRRGPQVAHAEHHGQVADAAVVLAVGAGADDRSAAHRRPRRPPRRTQEQPRTPRSHRPLLQPNRYVHC